MSFSDLGLDPDILRAVEDAGYKTPTPIQVQVIPQVFAGRDVVGTAQTGTGKTAGFTLPMIQILAEGRSRALMPRSLILEPTRELAAQVSENFDNYGKYHKLTMALLIGGVSYSEQDQKLRRGVDVLVATPGRLQDHFERGKVLLADIKILVIDEADRMLDMGFIPDIERIIKLLPWQRQTLMFSATMPAEIRRLASTYLSNPKEISVAPPDRPADTVAQFRIKAPADDKGKRAALRRLLGSEEIRNALIFCNRKRSVGILHRSLARHGYNAAALHGDLPQSERMDTLDRFKRGEITLLVASNVAARGLDIAEMSHVINYDVPIYAEDYVHRIGRTGRAGRPGRAFTLVTPADSRPIAAIERLIGEAIARTELSGEAVAEPGGDATPPRAEAGRRERHRRGKGRDKPGQAKQDKPRQRDSRAPEKDEDKGAVVGMGDHTPAFMLR